MITCNRESSGYPGIRAGSSKKTKLVVLSVGCYWMLYYFTLRGVVFFCVKILIKWLRESDIFYHALFSDILKWLDWNKWNKSYDKSCILTLINICKLFHWYVSLMLGPKIYVLKTFKMCIYLFIFSLITGYWLSG